jgi:transposase-like protein
MAGTVNLVEFAKHFSDEDAARELLEKMRWGANGAVCPHCGGADPYKLTPKPGSKTRKGLYKCRACRKQFTVTVGTVFEDSHVPISKWLLSLHLICASKKGMSAHQLHRMIGVTYKTAWFIFHRLRYAMSQEPMASKLRGVVEVDETYVGGRRRLVPNGGRPGPKDKKHVGVMALVERGGRVRAFPMERVTSANAQTAIRQMVEKGTTVMTDELNIYHATGLNNSGYKHETINHTRDEYVRGNVHTNSVEGFFSLLKRGINGTFHHVGKGHLAKYCDEFSFRYNHREMTDGERAGVLVLNAEGKRLTYKQPAGTSAN